jgi:hypothetical protein
MTLEQLGVVVQLAGTLGIIGSLIFVGAQVRQNTRATRVQVQENMTSGYIAVVQLLTDHAEVFTRGIAATRESFSSFSDADKLIYVSMLFAAFKLFENVHSQHERGFIDRASWAAWSENMLMHFHQPGVQMWWSLRKGSFRLSFRQFLESSPAPKVPSTLDVLRE